VKSQSFEVTIQESLDDSMALEITVDDAHQLPFPIERLKAIALNFYRSLLPTPQSTLKLDSSGRPRVSPRTYQIDLE
jgi:hypothetical protein